jgi:hypothetical protein
MQQHVGAVSAEEEIEDGSAVVGAAVLEQLLQQMPLVLALRLQAERELRMVLLVS